MKLYDGLRQFLMENQTGKYGTPHLDHFSLCLVDIDIEATEWILRGIHTDTGIH